MITPEYNHSLSGVLKNAIDNVFVSFAFRNKPALFVGYSGGIVGGARAVEQLALIAIEAELVPLRNTVLVGEVTKAFDDRGRARSARCRTSRWTWRSTTSSGGARPPWRARAAGRPAARHVPPLARPWSAAGLLLNPPTVP